MAKYDPHKHHRRSIRLKGWDYRSPGYYFVTICTHERENLFEDETFVEVAANALLYLPKQKYAQHSRLDMWVVMPNHIHLILEFMKWPDGVLERKTAVSHSNSILQNAPAGSLGAILGRYKSDVTRRINQLRQMTETAVWQRGYYERIIRDEQELNAVRQYIENNPARWAEDRDNLDTLLQKMTYHE